MYNLVVDMFYYCKILCDYKEEEGATVSKVEQDEIQDFIVISNEVIDTLTAIMKTLKYHKKRMLDKTSKEDGESAT